MGMGLAYVLCLLPERCPETPGDCPQRERFKPMMTATDKRESELWGAADAAAGDWFRRQSRNICEPMFLWYKPGTVAFWIGADGLNEDWRKGSPLQVSPAWTRERVKFWIVDIARSLPLYSSEVSS